LSVLSKHFIIKHTQCHNYVHQQSQDRCQQVLVTTDIFWYNAIKMDAEIRATLAQLGLNGKEIRIYLALLPLGSAPASVLGKKTNIVRSTAKYTCDQLQRKKLVSVGNKNGTDWYTAEPPKKIFLLLEEQKRLLVQKTAAAERILSELEHLHHPESTMPKVQFFEGIEGLIDLYENILKINSPIDSFEDKGDMVEFFPEYVPVWVAKRVALKIPNRVISPSDNPYNISNPEKFIEGHLLDRNKYPFTGDIKITGDCVAICSFQKNHPVGIFIQHQDIANNFRLIFEQLWEQSKN
jgi:HTH-type transcriptional regulator, sugar sensing transcriptional regulator